MNPKKRIVGRPKGEPLPQSLSEIKAFPPQKLQPNEIHGDSDEQGQEKEKGIKEIHVHLTILESNVSFKRPLS